MFYEIELDQPLQDDKPHDHCGIFGIFGHPKSSLMTYYGLQALQHRGQEGSGIVTSEYDDAAGKYRFHAHRDFGLVNDVFRSGKIFYELLKGSSAIGHNRYSTTGASNNKVNIQPLTVNYRQGNIAISHNGNLTNFQGIRQRLQDEGTIFQTTSDTEIILHLIARSRQTEQVKQIIDALNQIEGAFSIVILTDDKLIAARDPYGWRPLAVGRVDGAFVVASETCAFDIISAEYLDDVRPGEVLVFDKETLESGQPKSYMLNSTANKPAYCIFEYIYFSRPDSKIFGESVDRVRRKLGKALAREHPVRPVETEKVIVINVPDSSNTATLGFASENEKQGVKTKYEIGLIRSHYIGRTFIQPEQDDRDVKVKMKFNTVKGVLKDKEVVIVDDSIVRGTTSKQLVDLVRDAGPKKIHFRVSSPPIRFPCFYGMDFPKSDELIANKADGDIEKIRERLGVDSIGYLSLEKLLESVPHENQESYCTACFSGEYPTQVETRSKNQNEC
ncbi:MAG: amidophosphoribosyltransferase [Bacteroidetes bacterium]|nr:MAG: amidophosphoribosyltransferase [Bacteroidota bacterium]